MVTRILTYLMLPEAISRTKTTLSIYCFQPTNEGGNDVKGSYAEEHNFYMVDFGPRTLSLTLRTFLGMPFYKSTQPYYSSFSIRSAP